MRSRGRLRPALLRESEMSAGSASQSKPEKASGSTGILAGAVSSTGLAIDQATQFAAVSVATTDTLNWTHVTSNSVDVPDPKTMCLFVWAETTWTHSVASGLSDFRISIEDGFGNSYTVQRRKQIAAHPSAGLRSSVFLSGGNNVGVSFPDLRAGLMTCGLQISPETAGTLTAVADGADLPQIHMFTTGDTSAR